MRLIGLTVILLLLGWGAQGLEAGAAKAGITPPLGAPLFGPHERLGRGAQQVHDDLNARCLFVSDESTSVFLVSVDLGAISGELRSKVLELAPTMAPRDNIVIAATGTQGGTGGMFQSVVWRQSSGGYSAALIDKTANAIAGAMRAAYDQRQRATVGYASVDVPALVIGAESDAASHDVKAGVVLVENADGLPIAVATFFGGRPEPLTEEDLLTISAGFPGQFCGALEQLMDGAPVALFFNGASAGQQIALSHGESSWEAQTQFGQSLAGRVKEAANGIDGAEARLTMASAHVPLPVSLAKPYLPDSVPIQTLAVDGLFLEFVPAEVSPAVTIALRRQSTAAGHAEQFTAGLANDYVGAIVSREEYSQSFPPPAQPLLGPGAADWLYAQSAALSPGGAEIPPRPRPLEVKPEKRAGLPYLVLEGDGFATGFRHGAAFAAAFTEHYRGTIEQPGNAGEFDLDLGLLNFYAPVISRAAAGAPMLAARARGMLRGVHPDLVHTLEGIADGAQMPFDAFWLAQCGPMLLPPDRPQTESGWSTTAFAASGERAAMGQLFVARNLDHSGAIPCVLFDVRPASGHRFMHVGFATSAGAISGMNDAGLVVCALESAAPSDIADIGPPLDLVLRAVLEFAATADEAATILRQAVHLEGAAVLIADTATGARVLELGVATRELIAEDGLLIGGNPNKDSATEAGRARSTRIRRVLDERLGLTVAELQAVLRDREPGRMPRAQILNPDTVNSIIFAPHSRTMYVAASSSPALLGEFEAVVIEGPAAPESPP